MERDTALPILRALADGHDPYTGERLPAASIYQHPDTVRALHHALAALAEPAPVRAKKTARAAPGNTGKPWSGDEDQRLLDAFDAGEPVAVIAPRHGRSRLAIEARLARFGRVPMPAGVRNARRASRRRARVGAARPPEGQGTSARGRWTSRRPPLSMKS